MAVYVKAGDVVVLPNGDVIVPRHLIAGAVANINKRDGFVTFLGKQLGLTESEPAPATPKADADLPLGSEDEAGVDFTRRLTEMLLMEYPAAAAPTLAQGARVLGYVPEGAGFDDAVATLRDFLPKVIEGKDEGFTAHVSSLLRWLENGGWEAIVNQAAALKRVPARGERANEERLRQNRRLAQAAPPPSPPAPDDRLARMRAMRERLTRSRGGGA